MVALGADAGDAAALAERLRAWLAAQAERAGTRLQSFAVATAGYPADGATIDALLEGIGRTLARAEERDASQAVA